MQTKQVSSQNLDWSAIGATKRSQTPTYRFLYGPKSTIVTQHDRLLASHNDPAPDVTLTKQYSNQIASRSMKSYKSKSPRRDAATAATIATSRSAKSDESKAMAKPSFDFGMERQKTPPRYTFSNSLYPHLKTKTATSVNVRERRPFQALEGAIVLSRAPTIEAASKQASNPCFSGVYYAHVQREPQSAEIPPHLEWIDTKPPPFILRQKLAKQFRQLTRDRSTTYDGATFMGFGTERLKKVIEKIGSATPDGSSLSARTRASDRLTSRSSLTQPEAELELDRSSHGDYESLSDDF